MYGADNLRGMFGLCTFGSISNITSYFLRKYREAIEIQKHSNNLNRDNGYNINMENHIYSPGY